MWCLKYLRVKKIVEFWERPFFIEAKILIEDQS